MWHGNISTEWQPRNVDTAVLDIAPASVRQVKKIILFVVGQHEKKESVYCTVLFFEGISFGGGNCFVILFCFHITTSEYTQKHQ